MWPHDGSNGRPPKHPAVGDWPSKWMLLPFEGSLCGHLKHIFERSRIWVKIGSVTPILRNRNEFTCTEICRRTTPLAMARNHNPPRRHRSPLLRPFFFFCVFSKIYYDNDIVRKNVIIY